MRHLLIALSMLLCPMAFAQDDLNIKVETRGDDAESSDDDVGSYENNAESTGDDVGSYENNAESTGDDTEYSNVETESPGVDLDIGVSEYPDMVPVPNYPVYYAPRVNSNYFFYDGLYWVYWGDNWYMSSWYRGPWQMTTPVDVPLFVLRVPVRYYRRPPVYFHGWREDAPPRWGEHWGRSWEERRHGWDRWDHSRVSHIAPLPLYQRSYSGDRYPRAVRERHLIRTEHYHYQPREAVTQRHYVQPGNVGSSHARPYERAPVRERSSNQHQIWQPSPQTQNMHPMESQPVHPAKETPPIRSMPQTHTLQPSTQLQRPHTTPHDQEQQNKKEEHRRDRRE